MGWLKFLSNLNVILELEYIKRKIFNNVLKKWWWIIKKKKWNFYCLVVVKEDFKLVVKKLWNIVEI